MCHFHLEVILHMLRFILYLSFKYRNIVLFSFVRLVTRSKVTELNPQEAILVFLMTQQKEAEDYLCLSQWLEHSGGFKSLLTYWISSFL